MFIVRAGNNISALCMDGNDGGNSAFAGKTCFIKRRWLHSVRLMSHNDLQGLLCRTNIKDRSYPIACPEPSCSCTLDPEQDICPIFVTKREGKEYSQLLDVAAVSCIPEKDRFYCPTATCSALYQLTNNK